MQLILMGKRGKMIHRGWNLAFPTFSNPNAVWKIMCNLGPCPLKRRISIMFPNIHLKPLQFLPQMSRCPASCRKKISRQETPNSVWGSGTGRIMYDHSMITVRSPNPVDTRLTQPASSLSLRATFPVSRPGRKPFRLHQIFFTILRQKNKVP